MLGGDAIVYTKYTKNKYVINIFSISTLLVITLFVYYFSVATGGNGVSLNFLGGGDDGLYYFDWAVSLSKGNNLYLTSFYPYYLSLVLRLFSTENPIFLKMFNFFGFCLLLAVKDKILSVLFEEVTFEEGKKGLIISQFASTILLTFYISLVYNTTFSLLRDIWIIVFFELCLYYYLKTHKNTRRLKKFGYIILFIFSLLLLFSLRKYAAIIVVVSIVIFKLSKTSNKSRKTIFLLLVSFSLYFMFARNVQVPFVNYSLSDALNFRRSNIEIYHGGSQMGISLSQSNLLSFYINYFKSFYSNIYGPTFRQISGFSSLVIMITESIPFFFLSVYLWRERKYLKGDLLLLFTSSFIWFGVISIINDNVGTATRLRLVGWVNLIIVVSYIVGKKKNRRKNNV